MKLSELMYFMDESFDVPVIKSLTTVTESLTREFEEESHRENNKEERKNLLHKFLSNLLINTEIDRRYICAFLVVFIFS